MAERAHIKVDFRELEELFRRFGGDPVRQAIAAAVQATALSGVRRVTTRKLLGQYLNRRTGTLIRSHTASPRARITKQKVQGSFGSNLDYARAHELGFVGEAVVPAHTRVRDQVFGRKVEPFTETVRAHVRQMRLPAKHFLRDTVREERPLARDRVVRSIDFLARFGTPPTPGALLRAR